MFYLGGQCLKTPVSIVSKIFSNFSKSAVGHLEAIKTLGNLEAIRPLGGHQNTWPLGGQLEEEFSGRNLDPVGPT